MLATFMEILDTTVVNVAVPHIAGNMGATVEEGTWVVTSYLVSNAIILPMSGWLANRFGRRRILLTCVTGFTLTSLLCGMATSMEAADLLPRAARLDRRRTATPGAGRPAGDIPSQAAWLGDGRIRTWHHPRAHPRPHARRLDHRQLFLALDFLPQPSRRHHLGDDDQRLRARSPLHRQAQDWRHRPMGHRLSRPRFRHVASRARHRTAQRLVRQSRKSASGQHSASSAWSLS